MMYDLAIIGAGPAGYAAAFEAVKKGMTVVLFEKNLLGGTCLNQGCIPTKYMAHVAELYAKIKELEDDGIHASSVTFDPEVMNEKKNQIMDSLREGLRRKLYQQKILVVYASASIQERHVILAGGQTYQAEFILIAAGSRPVLPLNGEMLTSDDMLLQSKIPESLHIIGGGVIAVEMAHIYSSFGTKVTMYLRSERILRKFDKDIANHLSHILKQRGVVIHPDYPIAQMHHIPGDHTGQILSAIGRVPYIGQEEAGRIGIEYAQGIVVDTQGRTCIPGIYAAGDVISNSPKLAHIAMEQGRRAVRSMAGEHLDEPAAEVHCIYVQPEIAAVGLNEAQAREKGIAFRTGKQTMASNARTMIAAKEMGFIKLIAKEDTGQIIGAQLMCERASDLASELALAVNQRLTVDDLLASVRPHPSYCEEVREAAEALKGRLSRYRQP